LPDWETRREWIQTAPPEDTVGASIGISSDDLNIAAHFEKAGVDFICVDVAHGHLEKTIEFVTVLNETIDTEIMVGNVATQQGVKDLVKAGADAIKVGVGGGSCCITREMTGHGVPQASVVDECSDMWTDEEYTLIADGGIQKPGDAVKALMLGADAVMMGGIFGRCYASPGGGDVWGMASEDGNDENYVEGEMNEGKRDIVLKMFSKNLKMVFVPD